MATAVINFETAKAQSRRDTIREVFTELCGANAQLRKASMVVGWDGAYLLREQAWTELGYGDEHDMRRAARVGRSTWYRLTRIAEKLHHLSKDQFLSMTIENAEQLAEAPPAQRRDPEILAQAARQTTAEFGETLAVDRAEREHIPVRDSPVTMKWSLKKSQRDFITHGLEEWCAEHHLDKEETTYGLELLIAETSQRGTLVGFISEAILRLTKEISKADQDPNQLRSMVAELILDMGELLQLVCGEATCGGAN